MLTDEISDGSGISFSIKFLSLTQAIINIALANIAMR